MRVDVFPITSVAVHVTIVSPSGNTSGASLVIEYTPTSSVTKGTSRKTVFWLEDFASSEISSKGEILGGIVS